ncbi:MAG: redoxin family protein [Deltaproteobacteria bacterium]|nr:redoxin family protein [Deltaproteobacteria bacterium]
MQRHFTRPNRNAGARALLIALLALTTALVGCGSEDGAGAAADTPLVAKGGFSGNIDNADWTVSYDGLVATAKMAHRINTDAGGLACVPSLAIEVAKPDGTCKLELIYEAGFAGEGLLLKTVNFTAKTGIYQDGVVIHTEACEGWATEPAKGEVIYTSTSVDGALPFNPLGQPEAAQASATLRNITLAPTFNGKVKMAYKGRKFDLDLSGMTFTGDIVSEGSDTVQCVKTFHDFPQWELEDINPGSAGFGQTYGLDTFKGKKVVVALVSDWCNSCLAQTELMQKLQDQAEAAGHGDVQMIVINDKQKTNPATLTKKAKNIPIFQDVGGVDAWGQMNESHKGKFSGSQIRNSGYGFAKNGAPIMYFAPNGSGSLNLSEFEAAAKTVINAKDEE